MFAKVKAESGATNLITFTDGSMLSGQLVVNDQGLVLKHALLGDLTLTLDQVARIMRRLPNVRSLTELRGEIVERVGPIFGCFPVRYCATRCPHRNSLEVCAPN